MRAGVSFTRSQLGYAGLTGVLSGPGALTAFAVQ
jgi:hypothetical protein